MSFEASGPSVSPASSEALGNDLVAQYITRSGKPATLGFARSIPSTIRAPDAPPSTCASLKPCGCGWYQYRPGRLIGGILKRYSKLADSEGWTKVEKHFVLMAGWRNAQAMEVQVGSGGAHIATAARAVNLHVVVHASDR